ncbi:MAG: DUF488 domain-containing protein [Gemmataceae bacterium]|nr:DUF488 domain-containing protein [Gemmataceae bacterium]
MAAYSVGHSNLALEAFLDLLKIHQVDLVVDVRSNPYSQRNPQFNRPVLEGHLQNNSPDYLFFGDSLGGRPLDSKCYDSEGRVDYWKTRKTTGFLQGLQRFLDQAKTRNAVLMCAEEDPSQCHRGLMIGPAMEEAGVDLIHIRRGGHLERVREFNNRVLALSKILKIPQTPNLFPGKLESQIQEDAFRVLAKKHAYIRSDNNQD